MSPVFFLYALFISIRQLIIHDMTMLPSSQRIAKLLAGTGTEVKTILPVVNLLLNVKTGGLIFSQF